MQLSYYPPITKVKTIEKFKRAIDTFEILEYEGYRPHSIAPMMVTMRAVDFRKFIKDHGDRAAIKRTGNFVISSVWDINNGVEITHVRSVDDAWQIVENWSKL